MECLYADPERKVTQTNIYLVFKISFMLKWWLKFWEGSS